MTDTRPEEARLRSELAAALGALRKAKTALALSRDVRTRDWERDMESAIDRAETALTSSAAKGEEDRDDCPYCGHATAVHDFGRGGCLTIVDGARCPCFGRFLT